MICKSRGQQPENHYMPSLTDKLHYRVNNQRPVQYPKIEHIMNYVSQEALLPQPNYFNFWAKKLAHQRCVKLLLKTLHAKQQPLC